MFVINNEPWEVILVQPDDFELLMPNGNFALGACNDIDKTIYIANFLQDEDYEKVLCHELTHAAMFAYNVELSYEEEELVAEIISTFGEEIVDITDHIFNKLKRGRV